MRILFLSYAYPNAAQPQLGTFNRTMIAGLAQQHAVRVVAPVPFTIAWRQRRRIARGLPVVPGVTEEHPAFYYVPKLFRAQYDEFLWWSVRKTLRSAIREFRPDVVLSYWAHPDGAVAVRAAHEADLPAVVMAGGSDVLILGRSGSRRRAILEVFHLADAVVTVNEDIATTLISDGIASAKLHVVPRGIDQSVFHPGDRAQARRELGLPLDRPVLVGVGRLVDVKDWPTWLNACGELVRRGLHPACYVCGGGPLQTVLQGMIRDRGLSDVVQLRGPQSQADLARWYRAADLTVLSSRSEGVPNVLLEAIASGGSFVATRVGGIPEIADPVYDRLVPPNDPVALATAILDRLEHTPPTGLPRRLEPLSQQGSTDRLMRVLQSVVKETRHGEAVASRNAPAPATPKIEEFVTT
ncbi:MAG TPA: glycosyltransferase [Planctomycetaceae bacterium]|nr:glycosyltransferase [Planctomycetaceae bacterium]